MRRSIKLYIDSEMYARMSLLSRGERSLMDFIMREMVDNSLTLEGKIGSQAVDYTGLTRNSIKVLTARLVQQGFLSRGERPFEVIVEPLLVSKDGI